MKFLKTLAVALLMAISAPAYGGPKETAARAEYEEGTTAYNLAHYEEAAQHYEAAYKLVHDPNMLFNIAQSYRKAGKSELALQVFRSFLREAPAEAQNRGLAEKFVEELKRKIDEDKAATPASPPAESTPAVVVATPLAPAAAPAPAPADLLGHPQPSPQPVTESRPFYKTWWFWTAAGAAVVAGTVTAFLLTRKTPDACGNYDMTCVGIK